MSQHIFLRRLNKNHRDIFTSYLSYSTGGIREMSVKAGHMVQSNSRIFSSS